MKYTYTSHYEICDNVLNNIRSGDDMHEVNIEPFLGEDRRVKLAIVRKLDKDGYIHRVNPQTKPFIISITVEGRQFWVDGGYNEYFREQREKHNLERRLLRINIRTNIFSFILGAFVITSAIYQGLTYHLEKTKASNEVKEKKQTDIIVQRISDKILFLEKQNFEQNRIIDSIGIRIKNLSSISSSRRKHR